MTAPLGPSALSLSILDERNQKKERKEEEEKKRAVSNSSAGLTIPYILECVILYCVICELCIAVHVCTYAGF